MKKRDKKCNIIKNHIDIKTGQIKILEREIKDRKKEIRSIVQNIRSLHKEKERMVGEMRSMGC